MDGFEERHAEGSGGGERRGGAVRPRLGLYGVRAAAGGVDAEIRSTVRARIRRTVGITPPQCPRSPLNATQRPTSSTSRAGI